MLAEIWKPIPTFPLYEASTGGAIRNSQTGRVLKPYPGYGRDGRNYLKVSLYRDGIKYCQFVHRLIAFTFLEVNHINRARDQNDIANLEWTSRERNDSHWREMDACNRYNEEIPF
jgi:hypothetical protein